MDLYNPQTGQVERDLPDTSLYEYVIQRGFTPAETVPDANGVPRVNLTLEGGQRISLPAAQLPRFLAEHPKGPTARFTTDWDDWAAAEGPLGQSLPPWAKAIAAGLGATQPQLLTTAQGPGGAAAALAGQASAWTLGLSDVALSAANPQLARALKEMHPYLKLGGEVSGLVGSAAVGGVGAVRAPATLGDVSKAVQALAEMSPEAVKVAKTASRTAEVSRALKAAQMLPTPAVMRASNKLTALMVGELGSRAAKPGLATAALSRIGWAGLGFGVTGGAEGALWGVTEGLEEHFLGDPRELGDLLASNATTSGLAGFGFGGGLGVGAALLGGPVATIANRVTNKLTKWTKDGTLVEAAEDVAVRAIRDELDLTPGQGKRLMKDGGEYLHWLTEPGVMKDGGAVLYRLAPDGTPQYVTKAEFRQRLTEAVKRYGDDIGWFHRFLDTAAEEHTPRQAIIQTWLDLQTRIKAIPTLPPGPLKQQAFDEAVALRKQLMDMYENSPWPNPAKLAAEFRAQARALLPQPEFNPLRNLLTDHAEALEKRAVFSFKDILDIRKEQANAFYQEASRALAGAPKRSVDALKMDVWRVYKEEVARKALRYLGPEGMAPWWTADAVYSGLNRLDKMSRFVVSKSKNMSVLGRAIDRVASYAGYRASYSMGIAGARAARLGMLGGQAGLGAGLGAALGGGAGAALGGIAAVGAPIAIRRAALHMVPGPGAASPLKLAHFAHKVAQNKYLLERVADLKQTVGRVIDTTWARAIQANTFAAPIIGMGVLKTFGKHKDPRKATVNLRGRTAALLGNPELMSRQLALQAGPLARIAPATAQAYAESTARHLALIDSILGRLPIPAAATALQPAELASLDEVPDEVLEDAGLQIAAVTQPVETLKEIMAGIATPEQLEVFKVAHPQLWSTALQIVALHIAGRKEPLSQHQKAVLAQLGLGDFEVPPGMAQRAQQTFQQTPPPLTAGALADLGRSGDIYGTRETRRAKEEAAV